MAMVKRWCVYLLSLLGALALFAAHQSWLAWMVLLFVFSVPWLSLAISLPAMLTARVTAQVAEQLPMGGDGALQLRAQCRFPAPEFRCRVEALRSVTGQRWELKPGEKLPTEHCGQLLCKIKKCWVYDCLGLFRLPKRANAPFSVLVMPLPERIQLPELLHKRMALRWRPKPGGGFSEHHEHRLYRPGDGLNQIHWKLTAKVGKLIVREPMEPLHRSLTLQLELRGDGSRTDMQMGRLLYLGSSLVEKGYRFSVAALTGNGITEFSVGSEQELQKTLEALLCALPAAPACSPLPAGPGCFDLGGDANEA